jgi:SAM-dependent methyltransferase
VKREAPAATRNSPAIVAALEPLLRDRQGDVLEIGSGTGQHAVALATALPTLQWWPTDPDPAQLASIEAWRADAAVGNIAAPLALDAAAEPWPLGSPGWPATGLLAIYSANVVHITPRAVMRGLFAGAGRQLRAGGLLLLYGPFRWSGAHRAESNAAFDAELRRRDPEWGVRDVDELDALAAAAGLARHDTIPMPANNHVLVYERRGGKRDAP